MYLRNLIKACYCYLYISFKNIVEISIKGLNAGDKIPIGEILFRSWASEKSH